MVLVLEKRVVVVVLEERVVLEDDRGYTLPNYLNTYKQIANLAMDDERDNQKPEGRTDGRTDGHWISGQHQKYNTLSRHRQGCSRPPHQPSDEGRTGASTSPREFQAARPSIQDITTVILPTLPFISGYKNLPPPPHHHHKLTSSYTPQEPLQSAMGGAGP
ncbi:hypothetical protein Hamer_G010624 [Homarus americanus]|uniref:Uncharacterized protein n=1 Tax=Homarus americanus TaxID=6706 RepID=A0A8J5IZV5_HOMAM|nr:hypothetical protein Hamer_G010624 [Homarus americanus]